MGLIMSATDLAIGVTCKFHRHALPRPCIFMQLLSLHCMHRGTEMASMKAIGASIDLTGSAVCGTVPPGFNVTGLTGPCPIPPIPPAPSPLAIPPAPSPIPPPSIVNALLSLKNITDSGMWSKVSQHSAI